MDSLVAERVMVEPLPTAAADARASGVAVKPARLVFLDAYRGFIMVVLASNGFRFREVAKSFPESSLWNFLAFHTDHVAWIGCSFRDLIQPSFMFMVGGA